MLLGFMTPEKYRRRLLKKVKSGPFRRYIETPLPSPRQSIEETEFFVLDFETTGLDPKKEAILSAGFTVIRGKHILMRENGHYLVRVRKPLPEESVVIHKITDDRARSGMPLHDLMEILLEKMAGRVLLVHYAGVEKNFLNQACDQIYGYKLPMQIADTLMIEKAKRIRQQQIIHSGALRLFNLRAELGLPRYNAHSALEDAIATAELFLAQVEHFSSAGNTPLKPFLS